MVNSKILFHYNPHYYLLVVLPTLSNHIGLILLSHLTSPPYPRTESTLGTRDTDLLDNPLWIERLNISGGESLRDIFFGESFVSRRSKKFSKEAFVH
jgi:hypothetical protein